ncbi:MAG: phage/plasmid primase, P4 family, partial [Bacteroidia bacterium]|nr:phage/plasmid primase, P4 family [Bacteroidia bacterium]
KPPSKLKPDVKQIMSFHKAIHGVKKACYFLYKKTKKEKTPSDPETFSAVADKKTLARLLNANLNGKHVTVAINDCAGSKRTAENMTGVNVLCIDKDNDKGPTAKELQSLPIPPHMIVETSPDKLHAYWLVKGCNIRHFTKLQKALAARFMTDLNVSDVSRVMRVPGTYNFKYDPPFLSRITHRDIKRRAVRPAELIKSLNLNVSQSEQAQSNTHKAKTSVQKSLSDEVIQDIRAALSKISADPRHHWLKVGMALHSAAPGPEGYELWTKWSKNSSKFDSVMQKSTWAGFKPGALNLRSLFYLANCSPEDIAPLGEMELAKLFVATYEQALRFDPKENKWYAFDGVIWQQNDNAPRLLAMRVLESLEHTEDEGAKKVAAYKSMAGVRRLISSAELIESIYISREKFDKNPALLAVKNGVVDLTSGVFRAARPDDYLSRCANVSYVAGAKCPQWKTFIKQVTADDKQLARYIRIAIGYTAFGHAKAQVLFLLVGMGRNGKGVLSRTLKGILGDYAISVPPNLLTSAYSGNANSTTPVLAMLRTARMAIVTELPKGRAFDHAFIKQFAGGDEITARMNYGDPTTFKPEGKFWISANDIPELSAEDEAMWGRIKPLPFVVKFEGKSRDDGLEERLVSEEASGILNWVIAGAVEFNAKGLTDCEAVLDCIDRLKGQADTFGGWVASCCEVNDGYEVQGQNAWDSYQDFTVKAKRRPMSPRAFSDRMVKAGYVKVRTSKFNAYRGISLKAPKKSR